MRRILRTVHNSDFMLLTESQRTTQCPAALFRLVHPHRRNEKRKSCRSPTDSGESAAMQSGTMCWIGSLYISLPFGHSNATLPYEGTSTRSTCSKQNAIGDQLQRPPLLGLFFRQTLSRTREGGRWSINCSDRVQTIKQLVGNCDLLPRPVWAGPNRQLGDLSRQAIITLNRGVIKCANKNVDA